MNKHKCYFIEVKEYDVENMTVLSNALMCPFCGKIKEKTIRRKMVIKTRRTRK